MHPVCPMNEPIRIGVLGCGAIGAIHAEAISQIDGYRLTAVCDPRSDAAERLAARFGAVSYTDFSAFLASDELDMVAVCTPSGLHPAQIAAIAQTGRHIVCEKPIALTEADSDAAAAVCREHGVRLFPVMQRRLDPAFLAVREAVRNGVFGKVLWGSAHIIWYRDDEYYTNGSWRTTPGMDGGALMNQSIHLIDQMVCLLGKPVSVVGAAAARRGLSSLNDVGIGCVTFESGALGSIEGTTDAKPGLYSELSVYGEAGSVILRNDRLFYSSIPLGMEPDAPLYTDARGAAVTADGHIRHYRSVLDSLVNGSSAYITPEEASEVIGIIEKINASA